MGHRDAQKSPLSIPDRPLPCAICSYRLILPSLDVLLLIGGGTGHASPSAVGNPGLGATLPPRLPSLLQAGGPTKRSSGLPHGVCKKLGPAQAEGGVLRDDEFAELSEARRALSESSAEAARGFFWEEGGDATSAIVRSAVR